MGQSWHVTKATLQWEILNAHHMARNKSDPTMGNYKCTPHFTKGAPHPIVRWGKWC